MIQRPDPRLVLASASATRRALLEGAGLRFAAVDAGVDEAAIKAASRAEALPPEATALRLAEAKARRVAADAPDTLVLGADQLLVCEGRWFDKPPDLAAARDHLLALRGREHALVTALVAWQGDRRLWDHVAVPRLRLRAFSDAFLDAYLALEGERVCSSVGAYRLEGPGVHLFERVEGEHAAVLGLPLLPLLGFLRERGVLLA